MGARRNPWIKRTVLAVVIIVAVAAGIELGNSALRQQVGGGTPDFTAKDLSGKSWSLADYRGKVPVILSFYATWCGPCKMEYPHLVELQKKYGAKGLQVVMLTQESPDVVKPDPTGSGPIPILVNTGEVFSAYGVDPIPHLYFFNKSGKLVKNVEGFSEEAIAEIDQALSKS